MIYDARSPDYTEPLNTSLMSQANDVARRRHIGCYLPRNVPDEAKCETDHDIAAAEGIPIA